MTYNFTVRLFTEEKCFGPGIAQLLRRVQRLRSLRAAAIEMNMAYSKAWTIVRNCEAALHCKLLHSTTGGKGGGGAVLTDEAVRLLDAYDAFCREMRRYGDEVFAREFAFLKER